MPSSLIHNDFRDCQSPANGVRLCLDVLPLHPMLEEPSIVVSERGGSEAAALLLRGKFGIPEAELTIPLRQVSPDRLDVLCQVSSGFLNVWGADGRNFSARMSSRLRRDLRRAARRLRGGGVPRGSGLREAFVSMTATLRLLL